MKKKKKVSRVKKEKKKNLLGTRDASASWAPTAPPAVAVATAAAAAVGAAVAAAANSMHHCGGVDIRRHRGSTKYNKILDKKSEKRKKKTYLVGARDVSCLEPLPPLLSPPLPCPGGGVFVVAVVVHAHIV